MSATHEYRARQQGHPDSLSAVPQVLNLTGSSTNPPARDPVNSHVSLGEIESEIVVDSVIPMIQVRNHEEPPQNVLKSPAKVTTATTQRCESDSSIAPTKTGQQVPFLEKCSRILMDTWTLELSCWFFSTGCLAAIVVILFWYDGRTLPEWPYGITINTLVTLFVTLADAALMVPVSSGISQLKWAWFTQHQRKLIDFETFDKASRGFTGSFGLIWMSRFRPIHSLGAIITILVLAASAVTQQSIHYVQRLVPDSSGSGALSPRATYFGAVDSFSNGAAYANAQIDLATEAAIYAGALSGNQTLSHIALSCSTGNCTWPQYSTLGVCPTLADVSDRLTLVCEHDNISADYCNATLPGGPSLDGTLATAVKNFTVRSTGPAYLNTLNPDYNSPNISSQAFADIQGSSLGDFFVLWEAVEPLGSTPAVKAVEINFRYCILSMISHVTRGVSATEVTSWYTDFTNPGGIANLTATLPNSEIYAIGYQPLLSMPRAMGYLFTGTFNLSPDGSNSGYPTAGVQAVISALINPPYNIEGLEILANNVAVSLTNNIRSYNNTGEPAVGEAWLVKTFVVISWPWVSLIGFLDLSSLIFLLLVIWTNHRRQNKLWRSSNVALLRVLAFREDTFEGISRMSQMQAEAELTHVYLDHHADRWELTQRRGP